MGRHYMDDDEEDAIGTSDASDVIDDADPEDVILMESAADAEDVGGGAGDPESWDWSDTLTGPVDWMRDAAENAYADVLGYDPYTPVDLFHDGIDTLERVASAPFDDGGSPEKGSAWDWTTGRMEDLGEWAGDQIPGLGKVAAALGLGVAGTGLLMMGGTFVLVGGTLYALGWAPNAKRAVQALDPAEAIRAANPFR